MEGPKGRHDDEQEHDPHVDAQTPQQYAHAEGKIAATKVRALLGSDHLVGLQKGKHHARILQVWRPVSAPFECSGVYFDLCVRWFHTLTLNFWLAQPV